MDGLDVDADIRHEVPCGTDVRVQITRLDGYERAMIDVNRIRCRRGEFAPVERGLRPGNHGPRVRVGGRFAGEVAGVEFFEGGVDVFEVERDVCRYLVVCV